MSELDSFFGKFKQLWRSGYNADLSIKSKAGEASLTLSLLLDSDSGPPLKPPYHPVFASTSRDSKDYWQGGR